jgi:peptidoglycan/xylan/chitin deacetylase (PgdA/CDA1 family)
LYARGRREGNRSTPAVNLPQAAAEILISSSDPTNRHRTVTMTNPPFRRALLSAGLAVAVLGAHDASAAENCPPGALGTARTLTIDPAKSAPVGRQHFPQTLALADHEVVLTFDDGPWPATTPRVLDTLRQNCMHATFFLIGRNAAAHPELARRELADGHTVAHHSFAHPLLNKMAPAAAEAEVDRGFVAVDTALYGSAAGAPRTRFFRFPGFASNPALLARFQQRGIMVWGADLWASDWNRMTPDQELQLVLGRLEQARGGIVLFHDTKSQTAAMLPAFLLALKTRGYRVVHVSAATGPGDPPTADSRP